jgi:hypothetical protein
MPDEPAFVVGPADAVVDSRKLPAVTPEEEAGFVHGADLGKDHPDNVEGPDDPEAAAVAETETEEEADLPAEDDLDGDVAAVDPDDIDDVGFDDDDTLDPIVPGIAPVGGGS